MRCCLNHVKNQEQEIKYIPEYYKTIGITTPAELKAAGAGYHAKIAAVFPKITRLSGDLNSDTKVDLKDGLLISQHLAEWKVNSV